MSRAHRSVRQLAARLGAVLAVLTILGAMAASVAIANGDSRAVLSDRFKDRVSATAELVGAYVGELAGRAAAVGAGDLAGAVAPARLQLVCSVLGFEQCIVTRGAALFASSGPAPGLPGLPGALRSELAAAAQRSGTAVSGLLAGVGAARFALAVRFPAAGGARVLLATARTAATPLPLLLRHSVPVGTSTVQLDAGRDVLGRYRLAPARGPSDASTAPVPGTSWQVVVTEPDAQLFAADGGLVTLVPWLVFSVVAVLSAVMLGLFLRTLAARRRLEDSIGVVEQQAATDPLTGLANRRHLEATMAGLRQRGEPFSVMVLDLDDFKQVNDTYGHAAGDEVLRQLAGAMRRAFRDGDRFGRWGGDEFVALLPDAGRVDASRLAARLREQVDAVRAAAPAGSPPLSVTIGTACAVAGSDPSVVLAEADRDLLAAKRDRPSRASRVGA